MQDHDDRPYHVEQEFDVGGALSLSEVVKNDYNKLLVLNVAEGIDLEFGYSDDEQYTETVGLFIQLDFHHMKNPETGRTFHASIIANPNWQQLEKIRDFCDFLLRAKRE